MAYYGDEQEAMLRDMVLYYLQHPHVNPHQGSVPAERLQNILRANHTDLYLAVVQPYYKRSWMRFLARHKDLLVVFPNPGTGFWRIRWVGHWNWEAGDRREAAHQRMVRNHLRYMLSLFLHQSWGEARTVDDFLAAYPFLPGNRGPNGQPRIPVPPRGDLVRFLRQNRDLFLYNPDTHYIRQARAHGINRNSTLFASLRSRRP